MGMQIQLGSTPVQVEFKDIKNVHLSVHPPVGRVSISAPRRMKLETVRLFAISKLDWIRRQQEELRAQEREPEREFLDRESHFVWGRRCLLVVTERDERPSIELRHNRLHLGVRPGTDTQKRRDILEAWYRAQIRQALPDLLTRWQPRLGVEVASVYVQRMRTRWGSCNPTARTIRLNTELAKKPRECLEYVVVHELVHLLEPTHNPRFIALMDRFMPLWKEHRKLLNRLPVRHEEWDY
jgi:Predicted metal-dependent hydrolase